jgi:hypothetical protein
MRPTKYKVYLTEEERSELLQMVKSGKHASETIRRANVLLMLDENHPPVKMQMEIAEIQHLTPSAVAEIAKRFCVIGIDVVNRKQRAEPPVKPIVTGEVEAYIIAIACSEPPTGHSHWTLTLTAEKLVEMEIVPAISRDTVGRALKKRTQATSE